MKDLLPPLQVMIVPEPLWHYLDVNGINKAELLNTNFLYKENGIENTAILFLINSLYNSPDFKNKFDFIHYPKAYELPIHECNEEQLRTIQNRVEGLKIEGKDFYDFFPATVNTFRPFMISERVMGLIPITDRETPFPVLLEGLFGVLRKCNIQTEQLATLPYFKQYIRESLNSQHSVTVSNEDMGLMVLGGLFLTAGGIIKIMELIEKRKDKAKLKAKELAEANNIEQRTKRVLTKLSNATTINQTATTKDFFLGSPKGKGAGGIITHLKNDVLKPTTNLLDKVEKQFYTLRELDDEWEASDNDPKVEDKLDKEATKMRNIIKSVIGKKLTINGLVLSVDSKGEFNRDPDYNPITTESTLPTPTEKQFDELAKLLGSLVELYMRCKGFPLADYSQAETFWIVSVEDMLHDTANALITYLDNSVN